MKKIKEIFKKIIVKILKYEAKMLLQKHKPFVVAITGNLGKTTTKDFVLHVYKKVYGQSNVRGTEKSLNSEFGVPLTILGEKSAWDNPIKWLLIITRSFLEEYFSKNYPKHLILEVGADHKDDIKEIAKYVHPNICILTAMQKNLVHGEYFKNREEHVREKKYLAEAVKEGGLIIYNEDDEDLKKITEDIFNSTNFSNKIQKKSFGKNENANIRIIESRIIYSDNMEIEGQEIKLEAYKNKINIKLYDCIGSGYEYAIASSIACFFESEIANRENIENMFSDIELPKSRMRILKGINCSTIIDDTYNASPLATEKAIETVNKIICKGKKILVLGHMAELGNAEKEEHVRIANLAEKVFDKIIFVGRNNELYNLGIQETKKDKVLSFEKSTDAIEYIKEIIEEYDLILYKGSQSARVEKIVVEILQNYSDKYEVCRQEKEWKIR